MTGSSSPAPLRKSANEVHSAVSIRSITITGVDGFVGRHVARAAHRRGLRVVGVSRSAQVSGELSQILDRYISADLTNEFPEIAVSDSIVHLAGLAAVGPSFESPQLYIDSNSAMVTNICETVLGQSSKQSVRVIAVSTGAVYAQPRPGELLTESSPVAYSSPYVVSKVLLENQISYYATRGISAVVARPFNHIGPGQLPGFIVPDLAKKLRNLTPGEPLAVGNLETARDYLDVRDVAEAYLTLATAAQLKETVYNISSGASVSGCEILELMCSELGIEVPDTQTDPNLIRPNDAPRIAGSSERLRAETGWMPSIAMSESVRDFLRQ